MVFCAVIQVLLLTHSPYGVTFGAPYHDLELYLEPLPSRLNDTVSPILLLTNMSASTRERFMTSPPFPPDCLHAHIGGLYHAIISLMGNCQVPVGQNVSSGVGADDIPQRMISESINSVSDHLDPRE